MTDSNTLPVIHPGRFLAEILQELEISQAEFSRALGVSQMQISYLVRGARPVTAEMALLIGKALGQTPGYWLNLQMDYDLKKAMSHAKAKMRQVVPLHRVA